MAYAAFSDTIILAPREDAIVDQILFFWSYQLLDNGVLVRDTLALGSCGLTPPPVSCGDCSRNFYSPGIDAFEIKAEIGVGDPLSFFINHDYEASAAVRIELWGRRLGPLGFFNSNFPLMGFGYTSASGAAYNIEGATQIPEPASAFLIAFSLGIGMILSSVVRQ